MPPREGKRKKMKHSVFRTVQDLRDIDDFLKVTHHYKKKFYTIDLIGGEDRKYELNVRAIAISRDLNYKLRWMIDAKPHEFDSEQLEKGPIPEYDPVKARDGDAPILGWIPLEEKELKKLYPNTAQVPDEEGEHYWTDLFENWDFKLVDFIDQID